MRKKDISENDIYVHVDFNCNADGRSEYLYDLSFYGNYELEDLTESEVREVIAAFSAALQLTQEEQKGGAQ